MSLTIDGLQTGVLASAVHDACPTPPDLDSVLQTKLNDRYSNYAGMWSKHPDVIDSLIQKYRARWQIDRLVVALLEFAPHNGLLLAFAWKHQILSRPAATDALERMLNPDRGFSDPMEFLRRFGQIVNWVCRISVPQSGGTGYGTGLLIGRNAVLTNFHVVEPLITGAMGTDRHKVTLQFDYRNGPDGTTITEGATCRLFDSDDWLIDSSPYHTDDLQCQGIAEKLASSPPIHDLDYAVLRLDRDVGMQPPGDHPTPGAPIRGWAELPKAEVDFTRDFGKDEAVFLFQHPQAEALSLDWEKPAVLGLNANQTRVLYNVNTRAGSSGAPCFNAKLELIALHHASGKDWPASDTYLYNQGIPIARIRALMEQRNKLILLQ